MGIFTTKHNWYQKIKVVVFQKTQLIVAYINNLFVHSVLSKRHQNSPRNEFLTRF